MRRGLERPGREERAWRRTAATADRCPRVALRRPRAAPAARSGADRRRGGGRRPRPRVPAHARAGPHLFALRRGGLAARSPTAVLPRVGWLLAVIGAVRLARLTRGGPAGHRAGDRRCRGAIPFLLPRAGLLWSVPVLAPLLGTIALAPAFIGVAALPTTGARRAGLAAAGLWWVLIGEVVTGGSCCSAPPTGVLPRDHWQGSISAAASDALQPLLTSPALAPALVWAAGAVVLALVVRGRWLAVDLLGAGACAAALIAAHAALGNALAADLALDHARGGVAGCIAARSS